MALRGFIVAGCGVQDVVILPRAGEAEVFRGARTFPARLEHLVINSDYKHASANRSAHD